MQSVEELTVAQRLGQLLDRGLLPAGGPAEAGERLMEMRAEADEEEEMAWTNE